MATTININISGYGVKTTTESSDTRHLLEYSERQWQEDNFYTLLPGFSPVGYLHGERKLKKKKKKNCTNGQVCGFSCISKTKVCIANMTTAQLKEHNKAKRLAAAEKRKAAKAAKAGAAVPFKEGYSQESQGALDSAHKQNLYGITAGQADTRSDADAKKGDELVTQLYKNLPTEEIRQDQETKVVKLMERGLSEAEARGVASWIGMEYSEINQAIYASSSFSDAESRQVAEAKGIRLQQGLAKLNTYDAELMRTEASKQIGGEKILTDDPTVLRRGVKIDSDMDKFIQPYIDAQGQPEYLEPTFFATTAKKKHDIANNSNVIFVVKARADGTGQGKMVDEFKTSRFEGEVLYPAYSRFRVNQVTVPKNPAGSIKSALTSLPEKDVASLPSSIQTKITGKGKLTNSEIKQVKQRVEASDRINSLVEKRKKRGDPAGILKEEIAELRSDYRRMFKSTPISQNSAQLLMKTIKLSETITIEMEEL